MSDDSERRALLLHLGDVLDALHCVADTGDRYTTLTDAIMAEDSLTAFSCLKLVAGGMAPRTFVRLAAGAFCLWPSLLVADDVNRPLLASLVQHELFAGEQLGWNAYCKYLRINVPWFGVGLPPVPPLP